MDRLHLKFLIHITSFLLLVSPSVQAEIFYDENFESGVEPIVTPNPVWKLPPNSFPPAYGDGNFYKVVNSSSHNGNYSLRVTYEGRNGICNACGSEFFDHIKSGHDSVNYFIADGGDNLAAVDAKDNGPKAQPGKYIYNRDGGYSKWEITSVTSENATNDRLNLRLDRKGINGETTINGGDSIAITRQCGVDGNVGTKGGANDIHRRSDCNSIIMWFGDTTTQAPGESIFRRAYIKSEVTSLQVRQKLHYLRPDRDGPYKGEIVIFADSRTGPLYPELSGLSQYGAPLSIYKSFNTPEFVGLEFERGEWYYIEEEYKAGTVNGAFDQAFYDTQFKNLNGSPNPNYNPNYDYTNPKGHPYTGGEYRLWFGKSGNEPTQGNPTLEITNLWLPPISGGTGTHISFWGNIQHWEHTRGHWYIDDVKINNDKNGHGWNGPIVANGKNTSAPVHPKPQ